MVNRAKNRGTNGRKAGRAWTKLVNRDQDTQIRLIDGSTILVKGVTRIEAVLSDGLLGSGGHAPPIGGEISGDGK